jgi:nicotinamide-nucleotide amidase
VSELAHPSGAAGLAELLGVDPGSVHDLVARLARRGWTVATAESLTAGLLTAVLTEVPGASAVLRGGIVCYATDLKSSLVDVDPDLLARVGAVDQEVAVQLARGARRRCGADIGLGLTGVAGPDPQDGHRPGTVFVARSGCGPDVCVAVPTDGSATDRWQVRATAVRTALALLGDLIPPAEGGEHSADGTR